MCDRGIRNKVLSRWTMLQEDIIRKDVRRGIPCSYRISKQTQTKLDDLDEIRTEMCDE